MEHRSQTIGALGGGRKGERLADAGVMDGWQHMPSDGQVVAAAISASCAASSASAKSLQWRITAPTTRGASSRSRPSVPAGVVTSRGRAR